MAAVGIAEDTAFATDLLHRHRHPSLALSLYSLPRRNPLENGGRAEHLTELVVIVALMGAGLKIDRPLGWQRWMVTWRLLGITMPLSIAAIALTGWAVLSLPLASALLLGAALAPTDPVLATDVQVGPQQTGEEDDIRFALTSEAGLNDGLSFQFVMTAIAIASAHLRPTGSAIGLSGMFCGSSSPASEWAGSPGERWPI